VLSSANPESAAEMISVIGSIAPAFYGRWGSAQQTHADGQRDQMDLDTMERAPDPPALGKMPVMADVHALVITGAHDAASGVAIGDPIVGYFARGRHVTMPASGHYPWIDEPQQFVSIIESFLDAS
jgi:pimeloyl-ACP methyl ester carboxylesterase